MAGLQTAEMLLSQEKRNVDTYTRLLAPQHLTFNHFKEHQRIEGFRQDLEHPDFMGSDRLFKLDTIYGKMQMGFDPQKGEPFILANIKTSIHDTVPSNHQRELSEQDMQRQVKTGTQNVAYTSRRWAGSTVLLYKRENKRWSYESIAPYIRRVNMEALAKSMPFLDKQEGQAQLEDTRREQRQQEQALRDLMIQGKYGEMAAIRRRQQELLRSREFLQAILYRKDRQSLLFFRRLNMAYDWQKHEMFEYYRDRIRKARTDLQEPDVAVNKGDEGEDDE